MHSNKEERLCCDICVIILCFIYFHNPISDAHIIYGSTTLLTNSIGRGGSGAPGTWGGSGAHFEPLQNCIYMKGEDHQKSGIKFVHNPIPLSHQIWSVSDFNLHIKKKS